MKRCVRINDVVGRCKQRGAISVEIVPSNSSPLKQMVYKLILCDSHFQEYGNNRISPDPSDTVNTEI